MNPKSRNILYFHMGEKLKKSKNMSSIIYISFLYPVLFTPHLFKKFRTI